MKPNTHNPQTCDMRIEHPVNTSNDHLNILDPSPNIIGRQVHGHATVRHLGPQVIERGSNASVSRFASRFNMAKMLGSPKRLNKRFRFFGDGYFRSA